MSSDVNMEFYEFGKKMKIVAILLILSIIPWIGSFLWIIGLIFVLQALQDIQNANFKLKNGSLEAFRSKYYTAIILNIIGSVSSIVTLFFPINYLAIIYGGYMGNFAINITFSLVAWLLNWIAAFLEYNAWGQMGFFLDQNRHLFPPYLATEASDGAKNLKNGALMNILFFLIVTVLIGYIFRIIGFFKLAKFEQIPSHPGVSTQPTPISTPDIAPAPVTTQPGKSFCPNCGAAIKGAGKFCGECGSPLD